MEPSQRSRSRTLEPSCWSDLSSESEQALEFGDEALACKLELCSAIEGVRRAPRGACSAREESAELLRRTLERWRQGQDGDETEKAFDHLFYTFGDVNYTEDQLSLEGLDAADREHVELVRRKANAADVVMFLALVWRVKQPGDEGAYDPKKNEWGSHYIDYEGDINDYNIDSETDDPYEEGVVTNWKVKRLHDLEGRLVLESMPFDADYWAEDDVDGQDRFKDEAEENKDGSMMRYESNSEILARGLYSAFKADSDFQGLTAKHWYRRAAILLTPRKHLIRNLAKAYRDLKGIRLIRDGVGSVCPQIQYWADRATAGESAALGILRESCEYFWSRGGDAEVARLGLRIALPSRAIKAVMQAAVLVDDVPFFERAAKDHQGHLPVEWFSWFQGHVKDNARDEEGEPLEAGRWVTYLQKYRKGVMTAVKSYHHYDRIGQALARLLEMESDESFQRPKLLKSWANAVVYDSLIMARPTLEYIQWLGLLGYIDLLDFLPDPPGSLRRNLLPLLVKGEVENSLLLELLRCLAGRFRIRPQHRAEYCQLFHDVGELSMELLNFGELTDANGFIEFMNDASDVDAEMGSRITDLCLDAIGRLDLGTYEADKLDLTWMPILQSLPAILQRKGLSATGIWYQTLARSVIRAYMKKTVGIPPSRVPSNVRCSMPCDCVDCEKVTAFLTSPVERSARFALDKTSITHVEGKLGLVRDCSSAVLRVGPPRDELLVRKIERTMFEPVREWEERRRRAREKITGLRGMDEVLGQGEWEGVKRVLESGDEGVWRKVVDGEWEVYS